MNSLPRSVSTTAARLLAALMFCAVGGVYAGVESWDVTGPYAQGARGLIGDPSDPKSAYRLLQSGGFVKTTDSGAQWSDPILPGEQVRALVVPAMAPQRLYVLTTNSLYTSADGGSNWGRSRLPAAGFGNVTPVATLPNVLYGSSTEIVWKTVDAGLSWQDVSPPQAVPATIVAVATSAASADRVWAITRDGVQYSGDGGVNWTLTGAALAGQFITRLEAAPSDANVLYAAGSNGVFKSVDAGVNWQRLGTLSPSIAQIVIDPADVNHVYLATADRGVLQTRNGGGRWDADNAGLTDTAVAGMSYAAAGGAQYLATQGSGLWWRSAADAAWQPATPVEGLADVRSVVWGEQRPDRVVAATDTGIFLSDDRGANWRYGYAAVGGGNVVALVARPDFKSIYALTVGGVFESIDEGQSWRSIRSDLPATLVLQAFVSSPVSPNNLFVGTTTGLWWSVNDGASWRALGLEEHSITAVALDPLDPDTIYAATAAGRLFKTIDGGVRWEEASAAAGDPATALAADPRVSGAVYLGTAGGLKISRDGGATWRASAGGLPSASINGLSMDAAGTALYAATAQGVFRSVNAGESWVALTEGLAVSNVKSVALSPKDATQLALGLDAGGVAVGSFAFVPESAPGAPEAPSGGNGGGGGATAPESAALVALAWLVRRRYNSRPCQETPSAYSSR